MTDARSGAALGTFSQEELAGPGLPVALPETFRAAILLVDAV